MKATTLVIDLAKSVFQLHGVDAHGVVMLCRQLRRKQVLLFLTRLSPRLVGMEACAGSHYWARENWQTRPSRAPNESTPGGAVRKEQQERPQRRRGDLPSREPAFDEVRAHQESSAAGPAVAPSRSQPTHPLPHRPGQRNTGPARRIRHLDLQGAPSAAPRAPADPRGPHNGLSGVFRETLVEMVERLKFFDERIKRYEQRVNSSLNRMSAANVWPRSRASGR